MWRNDIPHGPGKMSFFKGKYVFMGEFINGTPEGNF